MIDLTSIKSIYKTIIDDLIATTGLGVSCKFVFKNSTSTQCPNCEYDPISRKSNNKYKSGGPVSFPINTICPICAGLGKYNNSDEEIIPLIIIFDYKKFISIGPVDAPACDMQSICKVSEYFKIKNADYIVMDTSLSNLTENKFTRASEPQPVGLGSNLYLFTNWKKGVAL